MGHSASACSFFWRGQSGICQSSWSRDILESWGLDPLLPKPPAPQVLPHPCLVQTGGVALLSQIPGAIRVQLPRVKER